MSSTKMPHDRWIYTIIAGCILIGTIGFMLPLLLTETLEERRENIALTQLNLVKRKNGVEDHFTKLQDELNDYQKITSKLWKIAALRKLREDHAICDSPSSVDRIRELMLKNHESMITIMDDASAKIEENLNILRKTTGASQVTTIQIIKPKDKDMENKKPNTGTHGISTKPMSPYNPTYQIPATNDQTSPHATTDTPGLSQIKTPIAEPERKSSSFPITLGQAALGFFVTLVVLVAFSMVNEYRTGEPSFFSPRKKPRSNRIDEEENATTGSYFDMKYMHEGVPEATPVRRSRRLNDQQRSYF